MYLQPWQIFFGGILCGIFISAVILTVIVLRIAFRSGVTIEKEEKNKNG